jgi:hypothetical protein
MPNVAGVDDLMAARRFVDAALDAALGSAAAADPVWGSAMAAALDLRVAMLGPDEEAAIAKVHRAPMAAGEQLVRALQEQAEHLLLGITGLDVGNAVLRDLRRYTAAIGTLTEVAAVLDTDTAAAADMKAEAIAAVRDALDGVRRADGHLAPEDLARPLLYRVLQHDRLDVLERVTGNDGAPDRRLVEARLGEVVRTRRELITARRDEVAEALGISPAQLDTLLAGLDGERS